MKENKQLYLALCQLLQGELETCQRLIQTMEDQCSALKKGDVSAISITVQRQSFFIEELARLEEERLRIQKTLAKILGIDNKPLNDLISYAPEELRLELANFSFELLNFGQKIKETVELNLLLTRQALLYYEKIRQSLTGAEAKTYDTSGQVKEGKVSLIDRKV